MWADLCFGALTAKKLHRFSVNYFAIYQNYQYFCRRYINIEEYGYGRKKEELTTVMHPDVEMLGKANGLSYDKAIGSTAVPAVLYLKC